MKNLLLFISLILMVSCSDSDESEEMATENIFVVDTHYFKADIDDSILDLESVVYNQYPFDEENYHENHSLWHIATTIAHKTDGTVNGDLAEFCYDSSYSSSIGKNPYGYDDGKEYDYIRLTFDDLAFGECLVENEFEAFKSFLEKDNFEFTRNYSKYEEYSPPNSISVLYGTPLEPSQTYTSASGDNTDAEFKITDFNFDSRGSYGLDNESPGGSGHTHMYEFEVYGEVTCKLYKLYDDSEYLQLKNGKFKLIFRTNF